MIGASAHGSVGEACSYALRPLVHYLAILLLCCHEIAFAAPDTRSAVADELLVASRPGVERTRAERIYHSHRAAIIDEIPQIGVHVLRVTAESLASVERALYASRGVRIRRAELHLVAGADGERYVLPARAASPA
jgi:hypothetical protein